MGFDDTVGKIVGSSSSGTWGGGGSGPIALGAGTGCAIEQRFQLLVTVGHVYLNGANFEENLAQKVDLTVSTEILVDHHVLGGALKVLHKAFKEANNDGPFLLEDEVVNFKHTSVGGGLSSLLSLLQLLHNRLVDLNLSWRLQQDH